MTSLFRLKRETRAKETNASKEERALKQTAKRTSKTAEEYAEFREILLRERAAFESVARKIGAM